MDDFGLDRHELAGSLITLEFGAGGRILQLWAADPNLPEEGQEYQFILTPVSFGEEIAEDYYPGTILLGARTGAEEPWIVDRNKSATQTDPEEDGRAVSFEYEFPLLAELRVTGRFFEIPGVVPQIAWDLRVANRSRKSIEIGELAFPMAMNNLYEGDFAARERDRTLLDDRVRLHTFIGGAASYMYAQRMNGDPPGLLVFPGDETTWEFVCSVPATLNTPFRWTGIPVVYVHSRAAFERENWGTGPLAGTTLILEPGDSRLIQTRIITTGSGQADSIQQSLVACGRPAIKLLPGAVAPRDIGIAVEVSGTSPTHFVAPDQAELETDADDDGGFCFVRPKEAGACTLGFTDRKNRHSEVQLYFTEPIDALIRKRAAWIANNQVHREPGSILDKAILPVDLRTGQRLTDPEAFTTPLALESGLCDALFLAEKNCLYPDFAQIRLLEEYISEFLKDDLQNPADGVVGSSLADLQGVAIHYGRPQAYVFAFNLYHSMFRLASNVGGTEKDARSYLEDAARTAIAMFRNSLKPGVPPGVRGMSFLDDLIEDLEAEGLSGQAQRLHGFASRRAESVFGFARKASGEWAWDTRALEETFWAARRLGDGEWPEKAVRMAVCARSLSPDWWSYGSDPRVAVPTDPSDTAAFYDNGEIRLGYTSVANSLLMLEHLDTDYDALPDSLVRLAFGGLLGSWALIEPDGGASLGYCPDAASKQFGFHPISGDLGLALYAYLRRAGSWVLPSRTVGTTSFGCHFETEESCYVVRPWDGVGRRVVMRQIGFEAELGFGKLKELRLDVRKRWATLRIENPRMEPAACELRVKGLWGRNFEIDEKAVAAPEGEVKACATLPANDVAEVSLKVVS